MKTFLSLLVVLFCAGPGRAQEEEVTPSFSLQDLDGYHYHDGDLVLDLGGRFVLDAVKYGHANKRSSGLETLDTRLIFTGRYQNLSWRIEPDLTGVDTPGNLYEAFLSWDLDPHLRFSLGQFRVALSSDFATREADSPFPGYAYSASLDGRYDRGLRADADLLDSRLWLEATATQGRGFGLEGRRRTSPLYSLRLVGHPLPGPASGWFGGLGLAYLTDFDDPVVVTTPMESTVFTTSDLDGDSGQWLHLETGFHGGPFLVGWERVIGEAHRVRLPGGGRRDLDQLTSWALYASCNLTGEEQGWERGRWVRSEASPESVFPGQWTLSGRYANADIDRGLFDYGLTTYNPSTQEVRTFTLDLSWRPLKVLRMSLAWAKTIADHELGTFGNKNRDSTVQLRMALNF